MEGRPEPTAHLLFHCTVQHRDDHGLITSKQHQGIVHRVQDLWTDRIDKHK